MKHLAIVIIQVEARGDTKLALIGKTIDPLASFLGARERGQQQSRENGDDCNHHQQLDQGKSRTFQARTIRSANQIRNPPPKASPPVAFAEKFLPLARMNRLLFGNNFQWSRDAA